jgi:Raf kinase inhibitor-like YbhB/YbcL family protein
MLATVVWGGSARPLSGQIDPAPVTVSSPAFADGGEIPERFSAYAENVSPPLAWSGAPGETRSFVVLLHDRDAPMPGGFVHWLVYNVPGDAAGLPEGIPPGPRLDATPELAGAAQGQTDMQRFGYYGPRPQPGDGPHHYVFTVYALSRPPDLEPGLGRNQVLSAVRDQIIGQGILTGTYRRP